MATWIGLFRGINVGGKNILPMAQLKCDLEALALKNVRTYIQSGNVVFDSLTKSTSSLASKITGRIEEQYGFRPQLLLLSQDDLLASIDANPFPEAVSAPQALHVFFSRRTAFEGQYESLGCDQVTD